MGHGIEGSLTADGVMSVHGDPYHVTQMPDRTADASGEFATLFERAIGSAAQRPGYETPATSAREALVAPRAGDVGRTKLDVMSDVERPGAPTNIHAEDTQSTQKQSEDRLREVYVDLTHYQVAWRIAQRTQQDISALLKGT